MRIARGPADKGAGKDFVHAVFTLLGLGRRAMGLTSTLRFLLTHPIGRLEKLSTLRRFVHWQVASRVSPGPIALPFVGEARLLVERGMTGATGNVYVGLHEFADMAFVLHALRSDDVFLDVGANIGSYTILAAKVVGCDCITIEPIQSTVRRLRDNIALNGVFARVALHECAVGDSPGVVRMTADSDTVNRVVDADRHLPNAVEVPVNTLDAIIGDRVPAVMKMDIEGYELAALTGAKRMLRDPRLRACIVETLDSSPDDLSRPSSPGGLLKSVGFVPATYDPMARRCEPSSTLNRRGNTLFIRDWEWTQGRTASAPRFSVCTAWV